MAAPCEQLSDKDLRVIESRTEVSAPIQLESAADVAGDGRADVKAASRRINCLAYSGEPVERWFGLMVIDLKTLRLPEKRSKLPMLMRHSTGGMCDELQDSRLGHWDQMKLNDSGVYLSGELYEKPLADNVLADARNGYPWEISVGLTDGRMERIPDGETRVVNGRTLGGGAYVLVGARLREASLVEIGADPNTEAAFELAPQQTLEPHRKAKGLGRLRAFLATVGLTASDIKNELDLDTNGVSALAAPSTGDLPMSTPAPVAPAPAAAATIEQLKALPGSDADFVLGALEAKLTIGDAAQKLLGVMGEKLKALGEQLAAKDAELKAARDEHAKATAEMDQKLAAANRAGGEPALKLAGESKAAVGAVPAGARRIDGLCGKDPKADWNASEQLRAYWNQPGKGGKQAFTRYAESCMADGDDYSLIWE